MIVISATDYNGLRKRRDDLYVMDDSGRSLRCLTITSHLSTYRRLYWLADDRNILFASYIPTEQFYIISIDNAIIRPFMRKNEQKLIDQITHNRNIFFSTHGRYWMTPVDGTLDECIEITVDGMLVAVSPDGRWLAYYKKETPGFIYLQGLNTAHRHKILMSDPEHRHDADSRTVVWSPDSRYLAYQADYEDLWVMRADGTQRRKVAELEYFWIKFRWSPDSRSIAFIGPAPATPGDGPTIAAAPLYVTQIDDPAPRYLAMLHKDDNSGGVWDWMPDGQHLVYATHVNDQASLYKIAIQTGMQQHLTDPDHPFAAIYDVAVSR